MPLLNVKTPCPDNDAESFTSTSKEFRINMGHKRACMLVKAIRNSFNIEVQPIIDARRNNEGEDDDLEDDFYDESYSDDENEEQDITEERHEEVLKEGETENSSTDICQSMEVVEKVVTEGIEGEKEPSKNNEVVSLVPTESVEQLNAGTVAENTSSTDTEEISLVEKEVSAPIAELLTSNTELAASEIYDEYSVPSNTKDCSYADAKAARIQRLTNRNSDF